MYETLPTGYSNIKVLGAKAQLIQNYRSKVQSSLDGGSWTQGWLLTGLIDPCSRQRFAAPPEQISVVSPYLKIVGELRKSMNIDNAPEIERESGDGGQNKKQGKNGKNGGGKDANKDA